MKVKVFTTCTSFADVEKAVNEFIRDKKVISILQSMSECETAWTFILTVMYED